VLTAGLAPFPSPRYLYYLASLGQGCGLHRTKGGGRRDRRWVEGEARGPHRWVRRLRPASGVPPWALSSTWGWRKGPGSEE